MSRPRLPPEICDRIIDHLHNIERTLDVCALVCRAWLPAARLHRFRRIELAPGRSMLKLLSDPRSTVPPYVRELKLEETYPSWLDHTALSQIPHHRMVALESVTILNLGCAESVEGSPRYYRPLSAETLQCLKDLCRPVKQLSLEEPETYDIFPVLDLISGIDALNRLSITTDGHYDEQYTPSMVSALHCSNLASSLRHLELDSYSYPLMDALRAMCPSLRLRSFSIRELSIDALQSLVRFVAHVGETLEHLDLSLYDLRENRAMITEMVGRTLAGALGCCCSLATMSLRIHAEHYSGFRLPMATYGLFIDEIQRPFLSHGPLSAAKLVIVGHHCKLESLVELRRMLFERLSALREEGRLEFERADGKGMSLVEFYLE